MFLTVLQCEEFIHPLYELTEGGGRGEISSLYNRGGAPTDWSRAECDPLIKPRFSTSQSLNPRRRHFLYSVSHTHIQKKMAWAVTCEGLTGSRLRVMQIVREIRLPVSVVVNGGHRRPLRSQERQEEGPDHGHTGTSTSIAEGCNGDDFKIKRRLEHHHHHHHIKNWIKPWP